MVDGWLRSILWDHVLPNADRPSSFEVHRLKGRLVFKNGEVKMIQGVREIFEILESSEAASQGGKIILIGRHVSDADFRDSFARALA